MKVRQWTRDEMLVDMGPHYGAYIQSMWLPLGLMRMESRCAMRIRLSPSLEELQKTREQVRECPHLHPVIKRNLLYNVRLRIRAGEFGNEPVPTKKQMEEMGEVPFRTYMRHPAFPKYAQNQ